MIGTHKYWQLIPLVFIVLCATAAAQVPGPVVNIDAYDPQNPLQKQLEVDAAANPSNPSHILAGYIDYRTVKVETSGQPKIFSSAWCGYSFSTNGGKTWRNGSSTNGGQTVTKFLVPGFPGNTSTEPGGVNSPIYGSDTCGDPVVAWDTSGHAFFMGLAQVTNSINYLFVARFTDPDDGTGRLNYDFTRLIDSGNPSSTGQDLDKPSLLFVPDPNSSNPAAGTLYACGTIFDGSAKQGTKVICQFSSDGGNTFSKPLQPNQTKVNQNIGTDNGTALAPTADGGAYVFWRSFDQNTNGYWFVKIDRFGNATSPTRVMWSGASFQPYDAPTKSDDPLTPSLDELLARSNAFPTVATDRCGRILLAFQAYSDFSGNMAAPSSVGPRIFLSYSTDKGITWSSPRAVDDGRATPDGPPNGYAFQFMPRLAVSGGGAFEILYYDARNDGRPLTPGLLYPTGRDRRYDVQVVKGQFGSCDSSATPSFTLPSATVSQYPVSSTTGQILGRPAACGTGCPLDSQGRSTCPALLFPNLPIAKGGTQPFIGDYIALAAGVPLVRNAPGSSPAWRFANQPEDPESFLAFFVSTQEVGFPLNSSLVPDINGDWTQFTPFGSSLPPVNPASRDANIYFSAISPGILASWHGTSRPVDVRGIGTIPPEFIVTVENRSGNDGFFRLTILDNAPPYAPTAVEDWSFLQTPPTGTFPDDKNTVDTQILPNSSVSLPVYYRFRSSSNTSPTMPVQVLVDQITGIGGDVSNGLKAKVTYSVNNPQIDNPQIDNPQVDNPQVDNPQIDNPQVDNESPSNPQVDNPQVDNPQIDNTVVPDQDVNWTVSNPPPGSLPTPVNITTNVATAQDLLDQGYQFLLLIYQTQLNPGVAGCTLVPIPTDVVISNIAITNRQVNNPQVDNPQVDNMQVNSTAINDPEVSNATFVVNPGEEVNITLRSFRPSGAISSDPLNPESVGQAVFSTAANPDGTYSASFFDETPPSITPKCNGTACLSGWYRSAVTVTWDVSDLQSGIASKTGCDPVTLTEDTSGTELKCEATNGDGDYNFGLVTVRIDQTPPEIIPTVSGIKGANGWYTSNVTVSWTVSDSQSGIASTTGCDSITLDTETPGITYTCSAVNGAGLSDSRSVTIKLDKTPPVISHSVNGTLGNNGWYVSAVTVSWTVSESVSGPASKSGCAATTLANDTNGTTLPCSATNDAGLSSSDPVTIKIDTKPPTITITAPASSGTYMLNASVPSNYTCSDSGSGVDPSKCVGPVNSGSNFSTATVGSNTFTVTATDNAGNGPATLTNAYFVVYNFALTPPKSPAKLGSAVPLVWQLTDTNGQVISDMSSLVALWSLFDGNKATCPAASLNGTNKTIHYSTPNGATGKSSLQYKTTINSFQFNLDTSNLTSGIGCYSLVIQLKDNSSGPNTAPPYQVLDALRLGLTRVQLK